MEYTVYIISSAMKALRKFRKTDQQKLLMAIRALADEPTPPRSKMLSGMKNIWRIRVFDNYRISYEVDRGELRVLVIEIATRGSAYRK